MRKIKGFTLIELMITMFIIWTLMGLVFPNLNNIKVTIVEKTAVEEKVQKKVEEKIEEKRPSKWEGRKSSIANP